MKHQGFSIYCFFIVTIFAFYSSVASSSNDYPEGLKISATGQYSAQPDQVTVNLSFEDTQLEASKATENTSKLVSRLLKQLDQFRIDEDSMDSSQIRVNPVYNYDNGQRSLTGYQVMRSVRFILTDLAQLNELMGMITKSGFSRMNGLNFDLKDKSEAQEQALLRAIEQTRKSAAVIAEAYGVKLGAVRLVEHSVDHPATQAPRQLRAMAMEAASSDQSTDNYEIRNIDFRAHVTTTFAIK